MAVKDDKSRTKTTIKGNNKKNKTVKKDTKINPKLTLIFSFLTGVLLIITSYAWFSVALDVQVKFFDVIVSTDSGLFISLDGSDFSSSIEISRDTVINDLFETYPNHTNQWSGSGLWPVSSNGIRDTTYNEFDIYVGEVSRVRGQIKDAKRFLNTRLVDEDEPNATNVYIAFDFFLKNVSGSPINDNLFLDEDTFVDFDYDRFQYMLENYYNDMFEEEYEEMTEELQQEIVESMSGIMNSIRFGFVKIGSVPTRTNLDVIQNISCNNRCEAIIYEPNSTLHTEISIAKAESLGITITDGFYTPTYAVIKEGQNLAHTNGHEGSGYPLDPEHFQRQETITSFENPIFQIPNGITKFRCYVWIEGQDIDSLETNSKGAAIYIAINFFKDLAGYSQQ